MTVIRSKETVGILFAIFAYFSFSLLDATQKTLVIYYSVFQLLLIKYFFVLFLSLIESRRKKILFFINLKILKCRFSEVYCQFLSLVFLYYRSNIYL